MKGQALESTTPSTKGVESAEKGGEASTTIVQEKDSQAGKEFHNTTSEATKEFTNSTFGNADSILDMGDNGSKTQKTGNMENTTGKPADRAGDPEAKGSSDLQDGIGEDAGEKAASGKKGDLEAKKIENGEMKPAGESGNNEADSERDGSQAQGNPRRDADGSAESAKDKAGDGGSKTGAFGEKSSGEVDEQDRHDRSTTSGSSADEMGKEALTEGTDAAAASSGKDPSGDSEAGKAERPSDPEADNPENHLHKEPFRPEDFQGITPKDLEKAEPDRSHGLEGTSPKDFEQKLRFDPKALPLN